MHYTYLEPEIELLEGPAYLPGESVHPLALLQGHEDIGGLVFRSGVQFHHVELLGQFLQDLLKEGLHLVNQNVPHSYSNELSTDSLIIKQDH